MRGLVAERERGGRYRSLADLAARSGVTAQDARTARLVGRLRPRRAGGPGRRTALWQPAWPRWQVALLGSPRAMPSRGEHQLALPLTLPDRSAAAQARALAAADRRLLHQRRDDRRSRARGPARAPDRAQARHQRPAGATAQRLRGGRGGTGDRQAAAGNGEGDDVPAVRGRVRDDQPDRRQGGLRAPPPCSPAPSRCCSPGAPGALPGGWDGERVGCPQGAAARAPRSPARRGGGGDPAGRERDRARAGAAGELPRRGRGRRGLGGEGAPCPPRSALLHPRRARRRARRSGRACVPLLRRCRASRPGDDDRLG